MDRDALLAAALGAAVLSGCTSGGGAARPTPSGASTGSVTALPVDPDIAVLGAWSTAERTLAARYAALVRAVPALKALPANHSLRAAEVEAHLAVRGTQPAPVTARPLRGRPASLVDTLADAERRAAASYLAALARVRDPKVATLGAELAAGARQHAAILRLTPLPS